jgi:hypothetical protein
MVEQPRTISRERMDVLQWTARVGAVTAEALADRQRTAVATARSRLRAAEKRGLLSRRAPLAGRPALFTITRAGLRASGSPGLEPARVSPANASHLIVCARVAAALERCYPDHSVLGERELRRDERECGRPLASALVSAGRDGQPLLHRPDLVLWPTGVGTGLPVAVEVELTVKSQRRLAGICLAWTRCRCVAGVLYLTAPGVERAVARALAQVEADGRIVVVPLAALPPARGRTAPPSANAIAADT